MGTSAMLIAKKDNKTKVLQYISMDGYISGAGIDIFKSLKLSDIDNLKNSIDKVYYFDEETQKILKEAFTKRPSEVNIEIPSILLFSCYEVIEYLNETNEEKIGVFRYDIGWFEYCNYLYVLNFDDNLFEIYYNHFSNYECKKCFRYNKEIVFKNFERIFEYNIYNLPSLKEFKKLLK